MKKGMSKNITVDKDGYYRVRIQKNGIKKSSRCNTRAKAEAKLVELSQELEKELYALENGTDFNITMLELANEFLHFKETDENAKVRSSTLTRHKSIIENHILPFPTDTKKGIKLSDEKVIDVTKGELQGVLSYANFCEYSQSTLNKIYDCLNMIFNYAVMTNLIKEEKNPMRTIQKIKRDNVVLLKKEEAYELEIYSKDEIKTLEEELTKADEERKKNKYRYGNLICLGAYTGLREAELCGLMKEDIDLYSEKIYVKRQVVASKATFEDALASDFEISKSGYIKKLGPTKTAAGRRTVPITAQARAHLEKLLEDFPEGNMLCYAENGTLVNPNYLNKQFDKAVKRCNLRKIKGASMHNLRHFFASQCFEIGIPISQISRWLGHDSTKVTEKHYITLIEKRKNENDALLKMAF